MAARPIREAAGRIAEAQQVRSAERLDAIRRATALLKGHVNEWETEVRVALVAHVDARVQVGWPPSFVALAGLGHLERPLNRLFAWWAQSNNSHGLSRAFLRRLALHAGADALVQDLEHEDAIVHSETAVDESGKMPDLMVKTTHGALLLENKHGAGQTGDQYTSYLRLLKAWASDVPETERRAVLCSRRQQPKPEHWHGFMPHSEVAALFRDLAREQDATVWARISALATAEAFDDREIGILLAEARGLLAQKDGPLASRIRAMRELTDALDARPVILPWRDDDQAK